ncbi:MAG TPA: triple tyrosine motif-containing protein [Bacteroidia bacterium]|jgi:signal transduction histidine kinase/ligand-binding sensor domain-containing protein|nr:triple tyrosine motif-containing protein [Bacteroidia bacterium]
MKNFLFLFALLLSSGFLFSQQRRGIQHFGVEDGLSQGTNFDITQDNSGFMWFTSADGLNRFDGRNFKIYKSNKKDSLSLRSSILRNLMCVGDAMWITTVGSRELYRMDLNTGKIELIYTFTPPKAAGDIYPFLQEKDTLWLLVRFNGIVKLNWRTKTIIQQFDEAADCFPSTNFAAYDSLNRRIWYISNVDSALSSFSLNSLEFSHHRFYDQQTGPLLVLHALTIDHDRDIVLGSAGGLIYYDPVTDSTSCHRIIRENGTPASEYIISLLETSPGEVWCGSDSGKVFSFNKLTRRFQKRSEPENSTSGFRYRVVRLYQDRTRNLWMGTDPDGIYKIDLKAKPFHHTFCDTRSRLELKSNFIKCFLEVGDEIYIGTYDQGINVMNRKDGTYRYINGFEDDRSAAVTSMSMDGDGQVVVSTSAGIGILEKGSSVLVRPLVTGMDPKYNSNIYVVKILPDGSLLVGSTYGFYELQKTKSGYTFHSSSVDAEVFDLMVDNKGCLWLATENGICFSGNAYDPDHPDLRLVISDVGRGKCICQDSTSTIWAGTVNYMLKIDAEKHSVIKAYNEQDGMPNSFVYGILFDEGGKLWISTNKGLSRFDPKTEVFRNFTMSDGLQSNEFNTGAYYISPEGELFFGGVNGFNHFFASEIKDNPYGPQCVITGLKIFDKPFLSDSLIERRKSIVLDHTNTNLLFEYAALEFSDPSKNKFKYRLLGLDSNWVDAGSEQFARFVNLDPGEYVFQVKASNNDGVWNDKPLELRITITPPFWKTWPFIISTAIILLFLLVVSVRYYFSRQLRSRTRELELKQSARMNAIIETEEKERKRIAGELHDGLGQLLSTARLNVAGLEESPDERDRVLLKNSIQLLDQACEEVRTISHNMMPGALIRLGLISAVNELINKINDTEKLKIEYDTDLEDRLPETMEIALYRIVQEVLNNMVRHAEAKNIVVKMKRSSNELLINISDDGKSFDVSKIAESKGLGWKNIHSRVELLGGTIRVESESGKGTSIFISIPLN